MVPNSLIHTLPSPSVPEPWFLGTRPFSWSTLWLFYTFEIERATSVTWPSWISKKKNNPKISKFGLSGQNLRENTRKNIQNHLILSNFEPVITGRRINGNSTEVLTSKIKLAVITMASNWAQRNSTVKFRFGKWKKVPCKSVYGRNHSSWGRIQEPETARKWTHGPVRMTSTRIASTGPVSSVG